MKKAIPYFGFLIAALFAALWFLKEEKTIVPKERKVVGSFFYKGKKDVGILLQLNGDTTRYAILRDDVFLDSTNKPLKRIDGGDSTFRGWFLVNADSVNLDIGNKDIDSLLKSK